MDLEKLVTLGTQLGLRDSQLREWVKAEQGRMRAEQDHLRAWRAAEREDNKAAAELQKANLQLKSRLQEGTRNNPQGDEASASAAAPAPVSVSPHNFIPPFDDLRGDLDAYLMRFERIARAQQWPEDKWAVGLSIGLTGDALTVIGRMTPEDSLNYQKVTLALLQQFRFMPRATMTSSVTQKPKMEKLGYSSLPACQEFLIRGSRRRAYQRHLRAYATK